MKRSSGSAEQSANDMQPADYMIVAPRRVCTTKPDGYGGFYRLAFYDICWNISSNQKHHTMHHLAREICDIIGDKGVDAVGISGVFDLREDHREKRQDIMEHLLSRLNSSAEQPATSADGNAEQLGWMGEADGHYIFVWNSQRLMLKTYEYISCEIAEQDWRMAQYLQFQRAEWQSGHRYIYVTARAQLAR